MSKLNQWLNIDSSDNGELILNIKVIDNAHNEYSKDFIYQLQSDNIVSLSNFFNYPNPFNVKNGEITSFRYSLPESLKSGVLKIYDISGKILFKYKLSSDQVEAGTHTIIWNGKTDNDIYLGTGVYYAMIDFNSSKKTNLLKVVIINE